MHTSFFFLTARNCYWHRSTATPGMKTLPLGQLLSMPNMPNKVTARGREIRKNSCQPFDFLIECLLKKFSLASHLVFVALLLFFSFALSGTYILLEKDGLPPKNQKNRFSYYSLQVWSSFPSSPNSFHSANE